MFTHELIVNAHLAPMLLRHLDAIPDERMAERPDLNHAAWTMGHLAVAYDFAAMSLGQPVELRRWQPKYAPRTKPEADRSAYPSKAELLGEFEKQHTRIRSICASDIDPQLLTTTNPLEMIRATLPTIGDFVSYVLAAHLAMHIGQLSAWRRTVGI